ncbi:nuclear transport factor 2 family protein [Terricaulis sp.]|uniref:nuclear transport factor 2 family protein n=1 Tax=Terricaulis sp. TaxID=2768686 RepID=UPI003783E43B
MTGSFSDPESQATERLLIEFNDCFLKHDPSALARLVADDCIVENTRPAPDGDRYVGKQACIALWTEIATNRAIRFEPEHIFARGARGEIAWRLVWGGAPENSVRGVNLMRVRDGQVIEARGYVKGA